MIINENFFLDLHLCLSKVSKTHILPFIGKVNPNDIKIKPDSSKATIYDVKIENILMEYFNNLGFKSYLAEESYPKNFVNKNCYLTIDPIDGTRNFINGVKKIALMISYIENEENKFSVIYNPITNDFYHMFNSIIYKNFKSHYLKPNSNHIGFLNDYGLSKFSSYLGNFKNYNKSSSIGYDMIQILEGERTFLPINKGKIWDIFPVLGFLDSLNLNSLNEDSLKYNLTLSDKIFFYYAKI